LLTEDQRERLEVVLVSPRNPLNIGAVARAMANFGFARLKVVAPYAPNWKEAQSAVGAVELLGAATETKTLGEAVAKCTLVAGTGTLVYRKPEQRVVRLHDFGLLMRREMEQGGRVGLVFGPEKHGLTREDLSYCHMLVEIPTDAKQPSMNLGQAVAVCLYELGARGFADAEGTPIRNDTVPPMGQKTNARMGRRASGDGLAEGSGRAAASGKLELLASVVERTMVAADYSPSGMREANRHDLRLLLRRLGPTERDLRRILGLFRRILWRLER
jgi:TrmH family RNA methyltransferase